MSGLLAAGITVAAGGRLRVGRGPPRAGPFGTADRRRRAARDGSDGGALQRCADRRIRRRQPGPSRPAGHRSGRDRGGAGHRRSLGAPGAGRGAAERPARRRRHQRGGVPAPSAGWPRASRRGHPCPRLPRHRRAPACAGPGAPGLHRLGPRRGPAAHRRGSPPDQGAAPSLPGVRGRLAAAASLRRPGLGHPRAARGAGRARGRAGGAPGAFASGSLRASRGGWSSRARATPASCAAAWPRPGSCSGSSGTAGRRCDRSLPIRSSDRRTSSARAHPVCCR